jgi:isoleucyl-tRNA synthetase
MAENKQDYKSTLNLPQTSFSMKANLPQNEPKRLEQWESMNLYGMIRERSAGGPKYVLHDGPPYANGRIHIGHVLNKVLKDIIVKSRSMMGYDAPYVPGWDCHGLPIEHAVDKELGSKKREMSPAEFRRACRAFATKYLDIQREDFKRLGIFGDWDDPYMTMSFDYEAVIVSTLGRFFQKGMVYKGLKPVHWCTHCQTALAEAEVEYEDHTSPSIYVKFRFTDESVKRLGLPVELPLYAVIWTTTPWTLPANLGIALHPQFDYAVVEHNGENFVIASELVDTVTKKFGWENFKVGKVFKGSQFDYLKYRHAFYPREGVFVLGEYVTTDAGTGLVHTAPGHGADDFATGRRYGLDILTPVNHRGEFTAEASPWEGIHVFKANPAITALLRERGALLKEESITHSYPHCWRCHHPVIFRATEQWFIGMDEQNLRSKAIESINQVRWLPAWGQERISLMVQNRPDWCISRQRLWGVPITVLYCEKCTNVVSSPEFFARVAELFVREGADAWYEHPPADFLAPGSACSCGSTEFRQERDILDVWFDSGTSSLAVLKTRPELQWPATLYIEGHDQHRGWFQSSLLIGTAIEGKAPFEQVITHGFVVDEKGRKMSKSLGNVVSPQDVMKQSGADILRMWVAMVDYRDDIALGKETIHRIGESYRKIRNTARFLLANLSDFDPTTDAVSAEEMQDIDRWIVARAAQTFARCRQAYEEYEFHTVYHRVMDLCTVDLSALYLDIIKDTIYVEAPASLHRRSAQTAIHQIVRGLVAVIAPILPFTAEEIYEAMPGAKEPSVHVTRFVELDARVAPTDLQAWDRVLILREAVSKVLERARGEKRIGQSLEADITLHGDFDPATLLGALDVDLSKIFIVSHVDFRPPNDAASDSVEIADVGRIGITMAPARGKKCARCWNYREEVTGEGKICSRCKGVVG